MRLLATIMTLIFSLSTFATPRVDMKTAIDELNYSLDVEWDQKDQNFYNQQVEKYSQTILSLLANGLTKEELIQETVATIKNKKLALEVEEALEVLNIENLSEAQAMSIVDSLREKNYSRGANWSGTTTVIVTSVVVVTVAAIVMANINTSRSNIKQQ